ncbi:hypothetical protein ACEPAH_7105 [Sanghuangporus vaninii]
MGKFIPCQGIPNAKQLARLFRQHIFKYYGAPKQVISDRGSNFTAQFLKEFCRLIDVDWKTSTAYHPQTDGQTERLNQELEQYLRCYVSYRQTDWAEYIDMAEFAYNNRKHSTMHQSPFYTLYGWHPHLDVAETGDSNVPEAINHLEELRQVQQEAYNLIRQANEAMKLYTDLHRGKLPEYKPGDEVLLDMKNLSRLALETALSTPITGDLPLDASNIKPDVSNINCNIPDKMLTMSMREDSYMDLDDTESSEEDRSTEPLPTPEDSAQASPAIEELDDM